MDFVRALGRAQQEIQVAIVIVSAVPQWLKEGKADTPMWLAGLLREADSKLSEALGRGPTTDKENR